MTETTTRDVSAMLLPELKGLATSLGIAGVTGMRKADLVSAIKAAQGGGQSNGRTRERGSRSERSAADAPAAVASEPSAAPAQNDGAEARGERGERGENRGDRRDNR
ncbi:MAG: hypothetical protein EB027_05885, partial [Actinobacteria bacterium]|nr:hypothetical protein [Actinomycetota bacterium]